MSNAAWRSPWQPPRLRRAVFAVVAATALVAGCRDWQKPDPPTPAEVRAQLTRLLPATLPDRKDWAADIQAAFTALEIDPSASNLCSVLAVTEQESTYTPDPVVPGLAKIARTEIERRAERLRIPLFVVRTALQLESPDGRTWDERLASVRTEKQLNEIFEELVDSVPLGRRLFGGANPVRTGGPMQVSIAFAEAHAKDRPYPYPVEHSIRREVFTRRGGMYFGIAHLLGYPTSYEKPLYRFADFNAGWYASRNAAFQNAVSIASGIPLDLDGDLIRHRPSEDGNDVGQTEIAVRAIARSHWDMGDGEIRRALSKSHRQDFEETDLYERVFALAEKTEGKPLPRAVMPRIRLHSPKITRKLTTEWFATRVDRRYQRCMARAGS
ncbi:DUF1615 domain-containing protein [Lysobacter korlensis]|uniref:DUF1615 domain-containing protein n=1 Tax=Lysobacter korlensis TaxID=553636 RepID=A0ABV6RU38_9GAMM